MDYSIDSRVGQISTILQQHYSPLDATTSAGDLLADLLHFLASHNQNLQEYIDRSLAHFAAERMEEDLPTYLYTDCYPDCIDS